MHIIVGRQKECCGKKKKIKNKKNINYNKNQNSIKKLIKLLQVVGCIKIWEGRKRERKKQKDEEKC